MLKKILVFLYITGFGSFLFAQDKLTLEKAISLGLENSYGIAISEQQTKVADLNNSWGMVGAYPTITGSAKFDFSSDIIVNPIIGNSGFGASVDANWTIFNGFKIRTSKNIVESKYNLAKNSEIIQIENCISGIILAYYSYIIEKELLSITKTLYTLSKDRHERDKMSSELGGKGTYELIQSESAYLTDLQNMLIQEREVKIANQNLNLAMSVEPDTYWKIENSIDVPNKDYALGTLVDLMTGNNSTLMHQYINQKVAEDEIKLAKGDMMPELSISAGGRYNFTSSNNNNSFAPYAGVTLSAPIFDGQIKQRNLAIAKIQAEIQEISIDQIKREMITSLMNQLDNYNYTRKILDIANRDLEVAKINLDLSLEKFNNGSITSFDYRIVHIDYLNSAINKQKLIFTLLSSNTELTRLIGGIVQEYKE